MKTNVRDAVNPEVRVPGRHYQRVKAVLLRLGKALVVMVGLGACREARREVYEIPPGLRGWVHVDVYMPECAPLDLRNNVIYFHIASNGRGSFGLFVGTEEEFKRSGGDSPSNERCSPREVDPARDSRL